MDNSTLEVPGVVAMAQNASFFKKGDKTMVKVSFIGSKDEFITKARPEHMAKYKDAWDRFCDGRPAEQRKGTPLTDVMQQEMADSLIARNVHTGEELALLSDAQCQGLGHGVLTLRENMRKRLTQLKLEQHQAAQEAIKTATAGMKAAPDSDVEGLKAEVAELKSGLSDIKEMLAAMAAPKKRGRPPKDE